MKLGRKNTGPRLALPARKDNTASKEEKKRSPAVRDNAKRGNEFGKMGPGGVEPPTSRLSGVRSNHLSYEPHKPFEPKKLADRITSVNQRSFGFRSSRPITSNAWDSCNAIA